MNVLFLAGLFPENKEEQIIKNSKGVIQFAADRLQKSLAKGMSHHFENFRIINSVYIGSFPKLYNKVNVRGGAFKFLEKSDNVDVGFVNLPILKNFSRFINVKKTLEENLVSDQENVVVIYAMHTSFVKAAVELKKTHNNLKIVLIIPDLPEFMGGSTNTLIQKAKNIDTNHQKKLLKHVDGFVVLSKFMVDALAINNKPWEVVEGIYDNVLDQDEQERSNDEFILLYTGTLAKRYGILNLLESFAETNQSQFRLWICGDGDGREDVVNAAKRDARIKYFGQVRPTEIKKMQSQAHALVNPRKPDAEYTKYSFPSKTMEYLASGTPAILYHLDGMPKEYSGYFFAVADTETGLRDKILEVYAMSQEERNNFAQKAKNFIIEDKNPIVQTKKIVNLVKNIFNENPQ